MSFLGKSQKPVTMVDANFYGAISSLHAIFVDGIVDEVPDTVC